jgi:hypothetical protein
MSYLLLVATATNAQLEPVPLDQVRFWVYQFHGMAAVGATDRR